MKIIAEINAYLGTSALPKKLPAPCCLSARQCSTSDLFYSAMQSHIACTVPVQFKGLGFSQQVFCKAKMVFVYTKTLLAGAMKPLNVLSKFEIHFLIRTVRFQVQLEVDGYFSAQKFSHLQPPQAGRVGTKLQFLNQILQI